MLIAMIFQQVKMSKVQLSENICSRAQEKMRGSSYAVCSKEDDFGVLDAM